LSDGEQTLPTDQIGQQKFANYVPVGNPKAELIIHERLNEETFGRIAKNLKWVKVLHGMAVRSLNDSQIHRKRDIVAESISSNRGSDESEIAFLLERIHTAEQCFSTVFTPVLMGLYSHKFELTELYGKYIVASYELAKYTNTTQMVTEELWEETLPEGNIESDYIASGKKIIKSLTSCTEEDRQQRGKRKKQQGNEFSMFIKDLRLAVMNLAANFDQLRGRFNENTEIEQLCSFLRPRIGQIDSATIMLQKLTRKRTPSRISNKIDKSNGNAAICDSVTPDLVPPQSSRESSFSLSRQLHTVDMEESQLNHQRVLPKSTIHQSASRKDKQKWAWEGQIQLSRVELNRQKPVRNS